MKTPASCGFIITNNFAAILSTLMSPLLRGVTRAGGSQKWSKEGVLRPEIVKGGGFEGAEVLQIPCPSVVLLEFL